ncbi:hypothetical protein N9Y96_04115 [Gammaproteobacteria bacterium]|nr:hypothetical protein [Gammaproteobacteria bacterium]MDB9841941.1 hypothetical protein [Gammaproteobacteria bacterium]
MNSYTEFAKKNFRRSGYQFNWNYLKFLYEENPYSRGLKDCRMVIKQGKVIGCIHSISSSFNVPGNKEIMFTGIHNFLVDKDNFGIGYKLLSDVLLRHENFFVPGVTGQLNSFYQKIGAQPIKNKWLRKFFMPNLLQFPLRFFGSNISSERFLTIKKRLASKNIKLHNQNSPDLQAIILKEINSISCPTLSLEYILWRIFGKYNNDKQTFVMTLGDDYAVFSIGSRKYLPVLRLIYLSNQCSDDSCNMVAELVRVGKASGAVGVLVALEDIKIINFLELSGYIEPNEIPKTYVYCKNDKGFYSPHWPLLGDYGFDEFYKFTSRKNTKSFNHYQS